VYRRSEPSRRIDAPEPGFFRLRLVPGGWPVPARILHDGEKWQAIIDGIAADPHPDPSIAGVDRIWTSGTRIEQPEYDWRLATKAAALAEQPDHPAANPRKRMDPMLLRSFMPTNRGQNR
jgi:hypothetical protein